MLAVYVDDFILEAVLQNPEGSLLTKTMWAMLHAIHNVFPAPTAVDALVTKDLILEKKLIKGGAQWDTVSKEVPGELESENQMVQLCQNWKLY
jgi:hypothetical protein